MSMGPYLGQVTFINAGLISPYLVLTVGMKSSMMTYFQVLSWYIFTR